MEVAAKKVCKAIKFTRRRKEVLGEDFQYVLSRPEQSKICFGSGKERQTVCGVTLGNPDTSPAQFGLHPWECGMSRLLRQHVSTQGTCIGGRKGEICKMPITTNMQAPAPGTYNIPTSIKPNPPQNKVPFNCSQPIGHKGVDRNPGIGTYDLSRSKHRKLKKHCTFGGKMKVVPAVETRCNPFNFDICERCKEAPVGDYWKLNEDEVPKPNLGKQEELTIPKEGIFLCRPCYEIERHERKMFNLAQIKAFKKFRDCSTVHQHEGCLAKILLVPPAEQQRTLERESYLNLYFLP